MPLSTEPKFGQVWRYEHVTMMLIRRSMDPRHPEYWLAITMDKNGSMLEWAGLPGARNGYVDDEWELLSEED